MDSTPSPNQAREQQRPSSNRFVALVLLIVGSLDVFWGLVAILNPERVLVGGHGVILADISTWGWVHLVFGAAIVLTGLGVLAGGIGARWAAVLLVAVNAVAQVVWFPAAPLWATLIILLDVVILYLLITRWEE